jgi:hypothetical protein
MAGIPVNFLELPEADRPDVPVRERIEGVVEVRCPACGQWRPGFTLSPLDPTEAAVRGTDWACDGDRTRWARDA